MWGQTHAKTIEEQAAEIEASVFFEKQSSAVVKELRQQLAEQQAYAEQLREALHNCYGTDEDGVEYVNYSTIKSALSIHHDTTALQEYGAKLVERVASAARTSGLSERDCEWLDAVADKIRKGEF